MITHRMAHPLTPSPTGSRSDGLARSLCDALYNQDWLYVNNGLDIVTSGARSLSFLLLSAKFPGRLSFCCAQTTLS